MEEVRPATADDRPRLEELHKALLTATSTPRSGQRFNHPRKALGEGHVIVATFDDYVAGYTQLSTDEGVAVVDEIYVDPGFRENGLGELLLDAAAEWARTQRCRGIEMSALPGDRSAKNLGERSGFRARQIVLYRALDHN